MSFLAKEILHKGLLRFWISNCQDVGGISASWANAVRVALVHLHSARSLDDILGGLGQAKHVKRLSGHRCRYSMEINANWRLTFNCEDPTTGEATRIDLEDLHRPGGARRR